MSWKKHFSVMRLHHYASARRRDEAWLTRPFVRIGRYLNSADFLDHVLLGLLVILVLMLLFIIAMAFLTVMAPPQVQQSAVTIELSVQ